MNSTQSYWWGTHAGTWIPSCNVVAFQILWYASYADIQFTSTSTSSTCYTVRLLYCALTAATQTSKRLSRSQVILMAQYLGVGVGPVNIVLPTFVLRRLLRGNIRTLRQDDKVRQWLLSCMVAAVLHEYRTSNVLLSGSNVFPNLQSQLHVALHGCCTVRPIGIIHKLSHFNPARCQDIHFEGVDNLSSDDLKHSCTIRGLCREWSSTLSLRSADSHAS